MPDNETINRHIAEKVMQIPCWHVRQGAKCSKCGECLCAKCNRIRSGYVTNPDYCSDDSPRRLLNEAVDKAVEMRGENAFLIAMYGSVNGDGRNQGDVRCELLRATAQQIATAIYHATKGEGK
jgi:hypothetical protein